MKTLIKLIGSCLLIVNTCLLLEAQIIYFNTSQGDIYTIDASNCDLQLIGSFTLPNGNNASFEDIAFTENGTLIGVDDGNLYQVNLTLGTVTDLGLFITGTFITGLVGAQGNTLYASGGSLHFIDLDAGTVTNLGNLPQSSAGDLAFNNGELYMAAQGNNLYQINIGNPPASTNIGQMNVGGATIFGIVSSSENCSPTQTFATSNDNDLYNVSVNNAGTALICPSILPNGNSIFGAATTTDFESAACTLTIDLDADDSSGATDADFFGVTQCNNNPASIVDLDLSLTTDDAIDSVQVFISNGILDSPDEILNFNDVFPNLDFTINNGIITLINTGAATTQEFIDALLSITYENTNANFSQGTRLITVIAFADNLATDPAIATITLNVSANLNVDLGIDQQFCDQANFTLDATQNFPNLSYQWSTGLVSETLTVTTTGTYSVVVTDNLCGGTDTDEIVIEFNNSVNQTETLIACQGETANFDGTEILAGQSQQFQYLTTVGCDSIIDVSVDTHPNITAEITTDSLTIQANESIEIPTNIDLTNTQTIEWQSSLTLDCDDCPNPVASPVSTSTYNLLITDVNGCTYTDVILIEVEPIEPPTPPVVEENSILIPTAFSPNGDGFNDIFNPILFEAFDNFEMNVYNRWGQNVFSSNNPATGWNGSFNGESCELGVYMYYLSIDFEDSGHYTSKGNVTLLR